MGAAPCQTTTEHPPKAWNLAHPRGGQRKRSSWTKPIACAPPFSPISTTGSLGPYRHALLPPCLALTWQGTAYTHPRREQLPVTLQIWGRWGVQVSQLIQLLLQQIPLGLEFFLSAQSKMEKMVSFMQGLLPSQEEDTTEEKRRIGRSMHRKGSFAKGSTSVAEGQGSTRLSKEVGLWNKASSIWLLPGGPAYSN